MKEVIQQLFGEGKDLEWWQMGARALVMFFVTMIYIRISGRRSFGMKSSFDNAITILLGAILSRAVVGASPFIATLTAGLVLVLLHRAIAWLCIHNKKINDLIEGRAIILYDSGRIHKENLNRSLLAEEDLLEEIRATGNATGFDGIKTIILERGGKISIVKKANI